MAKQFINFVILLIIITTKHTFTSQSIKSAEGTNRASKKFEALDQVSYLMPIKEIIAGYVGTKWELLQSIKQKNRITKLACSPLSAQLAFLTHGTVVLTYLDKSKPSIAISKKVDEFCFSPNGQFLASCHFDSCNIAVLNVLTETLLPIITIKDINPFACAISSDGNLAVSNRQTVYIGDIRSFTPITLTTTAGYVSHLLYSPSGNQLCTSGELESLIFEKENQISSAKWRRKKQLPGAKNIVFSIDGKHIALATGKEIVIYDTHDFHISGILQLKNCENQFTFYHLCYSPCNKYIAVGYSEYNAGSYVSKLIIFDAKNYNEMQTINLPSKDPDQNDEIYTMLDELNSVSFTADGLRLLTMQTNSDFINIWNAPTHLEAQKSDDK